MTTIASTVEELLANVMRPTHEIGERETATHDAIGRFIEQISFATAAELRIAVLSIWDAPFVDLPVWALFLLCSLAEARNPNESSVLTACAAILESHGPDRDDIATEFRDRAKSVTDVNG